MTSTRRQRVRQKFPLFPRVINKKATGSHPVPYHRSRGKTFGKTCRYRTACISTASRRPSRRHVCAKMMRCVVHLLLWITLKTFEVGFWPIRQVRKLTRPERCPPIKNELLLVPATSLAEKIRKREVSSEAVVKAYVDRAKEVNPVVNAIVEDRFALAVGEAKKVDSYLRETTLTQAELETRYPLLGVPLTVKESIALVGHSFNAGVTGPWRRNATYDNGGVKLLKEAGAIPLLKSNTPENCTNWETVNKFTGRTLNPYDTRRTCGGSSGGEAVLLATAASVAGVGSDVAGSLRLPPSFCGVYGHKPSPGLVSNDGNLPPCTGNVQRWDFVFATGPMSRYAVDLPLLLHVMVKPEKKYIFKFGQRSNAKAIKIFYMEYDGGSVLTHLVQRDIVTAMRKLVNHLKREGYQVKNAAIKEMSHSPDLAFVPLLSIDGVATVFDEGRRNIFLEMLKTLACSSSVQPTSILFNVMSSLTKCLASRKRVTNLQNEVNRLRETFAAMLKDDGVFLYPTFPSVAHFHGEVYSKSCDSSYLAIFNVLGLPITVCPIGQNAEGLPIGIQVVANVYMDHLCFAVAQDLEKSYGGWVAPPFSEAKESA